MASRILVFDQSDRILLGLSSYSGEYCVPGGQPETDEHPVDTALRELKEECNIPSSSVENLVYLGCFMGDEIFSLEVGDAFPQTSFDPDSEFLVAQWFSLRALPPNLAEYSSDLIYHLLGGKPLEVEGNHRQELPVMPEGFDITRSGNRWEIKTQQHPDLDFDAIINIPTKTARIVKLVPKTSNAGRWVDWFEGLAHDQGCLRVITELPQHELWEEKKYSTIDRGPGLNPSFKKILTWVTQSGYIEVLINGKPKFHLRDDTIWETLPGLAQYRSRGDKIEFRQVMDDGKVENFDLDVMPFPPKS